MGALDCGLVVAMTRPARRQPHPAAPAPANGLVKAAWMLLYTEGGRWTALEIHKKLRFDTSIQVVRVVLREMHERGHVVRSKFENVDGDSSVQYGVHRSCKVPRGVTVDEMWVVLGLKPKDGQ